jgi:hypothetical protein
MVYLDARDYPSIRRAIDVSLDSAQLPDGVISDPLYAGVAESWVVAHVGAFETATPLAQQHGKLAAILYTASLLVLALPQLLSETLEGTGTYHREKVDRQERARELAGRAQDEVALCGVDTSRNFPRARMFARAPGGRGA